MYIGLLTLSPLSYAPQQKVFRRFPSQHGDFIHDMSFDFYGKRLATCSSDRKIKVWEERGDEWWLEYEWNAHQASVWKVAWAHPEFGQILASCSFDRTVSIWEDQGMYVHSSGGGSGGPNGVAAAPVVVGGGSTATSPPASGGSGGNAANGAGSVAHHHSVGVKEGWRNQAQLVDARESVHDVKFAPRHLGLRLVSGKTLVYTIRGCVND